MVLCASENNRRSEAHNRGNESTVAQHVGLTTAYVRARCESPGSHILLLVTRAAHSMDDYCAFFYHSTASHRTSLSVNQDAYMMDDDEGGDDDGR